MIGSIAAWLPYVLVPALILSVVAQLFVQFVLVRCESAGTRMSGYAVARHILDGAGKYDVAVEQARGPQSDHFDAQRDRLQLSEEVFHGRNVATMAVAAHEACHALQKAGGSRLMVVRDVAIAAATFGSGGGILIALVGLVGRVTPLLALGILMFCAATYFQLVNLPLELRASQLALQQLVALGMVPPSELRRTRQALVAVAFTPVGATLQGLLWLLQRGMALLAGRPQDDEP